MNRNPFLQLKNVTFGYPGRKINVLEHFNMTLECSSRIGLIGPNGCGKTTLFHLIMGIVFPAQGEIFFKGEEVSGRSGYTRLRQGIGLLFQDADDQLFSPTVLEDVAFGPLNMGVGKKEAVRTAEKTLANLGLEKFGGRITHKLSGGEKKLVSLATILAMEPDLLLLDEPTNNLDPETRSRLIEILSSLSTGYVIISHDWDFLADTSDELYSMQPGRITECTKAHIHNHSHAHVHGEQPHRHGNN